MPLKKLFRIIRPADRAPHTRKDLLPLVNRRTPFHHQQVPFIVCWSQKAGCTAVLKWFFYQANLLDAALEYRNPNRKLQLHNYENRVFKARPGYREELVDEIIAGKPVVKFVRCPYQRLFSSYMQVNNPRFLYLQALQQATPGMLLRQAILEFLYGEVTDIGRPISFRGYLDWLKEQNPETLDPHHAPQSILLDEAIEITYYRLEDFDHSIDTLEKTFSLKTTSAIRDQFSSGHHHKKRQVSRSDALRFLTEAVPLSQLGEIDIPQITSAFMETTEFAPLIKELFARDIAIHDSLTADQIASV